MYTGYSRLLRTDKLLMWGKSHLFIEAIGQTIPLLLVKIYSHDEANFTYGVFDALFILFGILNLIDVCGELFI